MDPISQGLAILKFFKPNQSVSTLLTSFTDLFDLKLSKLKQEANSEDAPVEKSEEISVDKSEFSLLNQMPECIEAIED